MRHSPSLPTRLKLFALLGDVTVFLAFAVIGRASHHDTGSGWLFGTLSTATPFAVGWFLVAPRGGAYCAEAVYSQPASVRTILRSWIPGCLLGCGIRSALERHFTPLPFVLIAFAFNGVFLAAWRAAFVALLHRYEGSAGGR